MSYQSSVIKEAASIPTYVDELIRTWKGNSVCSSLSLSSVLDSCLTSHTALCNSLPPSLPPCLPAPHSVCLSILGNVLCVQIEILGESFPDCLNFFFPSFFFISFPNLSLDFIPFSLLTPVILSAYVVCLSFSPSHTLFHISSWGRHSSIAFSLVSLTSLPRSVSSLFHGLVTVRSTARDKCV